MEVCEVKFIIFLIASDSFELQVTLFWFVLCFSLKL